jgi:drug/metabolite transporter (DMT)-like permease
MNDISKAYLQLHIAVFLWGFTAILGKLISLEEVPLVWWRMGITSVSLLLVPKAIQGLQSMSRKDIVTFGMIGVLVCAHWVTFYGSIKYSNVSLALSCLATASLFTSFIEPLIFKKKINLLEIILGLVVIGGFYLVFKVGQLYTVGIVMGIISAFLAALFSTLNKKYIANHNTRTITLVELTIGFLVLSIIAPFLNFMDIGGVWIPNTYDLVYLVILALICTTLPFILSLNALKHLSVFSSNLTINLEPVYGIILAIPFFNENRDLSIEFYLGTALILSAVFLHPILKNKIRF